MAIQFSGSARDLLLRKGTARVAVATLSLLLWAYVLFGSEGLGRQRQHIARRAQLEAQLAGELDRNAALWAEVDALRRDDLEIERAIRAELDYQRPGEVVLVVEDGDPLRGGLRPRARTTNIVPPPVPERLRLSARPAQKPPAAPR